MKTFVYPLFSKVGHQIVMEGNNVRQALQELLETYPAMRQGGRELDTALEAVMRRTRDFRRQLRKADKTEILDNLSEDDSKSDFPERANEQDLVENGQMTPLDLLIMAAQKGKQFFQFFPTYSIEWFLYKVTRSRWSTVPRCSRHTPSS